MNKMKTLKIFWKDAKFFRRFWRIECDRRLAKGRLSILEIIFASCFVLVLIPALIWAIGCGAQKIFSIMPIESCEGLKNGLFWDTIESYLNPSNHTDGGYSFSRRLYFFIVGILGVLFLNGLLVSFLVSYFESRREKWENGLLHYKQEALGVYSVVVGGNEMVPNLVGELLKKLDYVLIMTNRDVPSLRKKLLSSLGEDYERKIVIYYGERTSIEDLKLLELQGACEIYVIGEQLDIYQNGSHHDVKNMDCVQKMSMLLKTHTEYNACISSYNARKKQAKGLKEEFNEPDPRIVCHVMFEYQSTFSVFQFADVNDGISEMLDFKPFNFYETWAQKVMVCQSLTPTISPNSYLPLEGVSPITKDSEDSVHLIIVGMSRMGIAMAVEAAHIAHYPNYISEDKHTRITFIDSQARKEMNYFQGHYKELFAVSRWRYIEAERGSYYGDDTIIDDTDWICSRNDNENSEYKDREEYSLGKQLVDVEWQFIQGDLEMPCIQNYIKSEVQRKDCRLTIAICIPQDNTSLAASLYLPDVVYETENNVVQVLVYQPYGDAMCRSFNDESGNIYKSYKLFAKLRAFGMMDGCYSLKAQKIMQTVYEAINKAYNDYTEKNPSIPSRTGLRQELEMAVIKVGKSDTAKQWSNFYSASHLWTKLRSIEYDHKSGDLSPMERELLAKVEHIRWNMEQLLLGYAPLKFREQKELLANRVHAEKVDMPNIDQQELKKKEQANQEYVLKVKKWLNAWKDYDDMKETLKANMTHVDICSYKVLKRIDAEAISYDEVIVRVLPQIYRLIQSKNPS